MLLFDVERDEEGRPRLALPAPQVPTAEQAFRRRCYLNGVTDPAAVARLWADERARAKAQEPDTRRDRR